MGLTQERLAEKVSLSPTYLAKLEAGNRTPSIETLMALATELELDLGDLVTGIGEDGEMTKLTNLSTALVGLSPEDIGFVEQQLLHLVSYLRHCGR